MTFPDFLFSSFHTFNFFNFHSHIQILPLLSSHSILHSTSIYKFSQIPFYLTLQFSQIFRSSSVPSTSPLNSTLSFRCPCSSIFFPLSTNPATSHPCLSSPILLVPYSFYFISLNYSFFRYFFFVQRFSVYRFHLSLGVPPGGVRVFHFPFRLVLPSPGLFRALAPSCGWHSRLLETKLCVPPNSPVVNPTSLSILFKNQRIIDEFPLSHICPQFPICLSDSSITISLPRDNPSFLALPIIQILHGAHTDTSSLHAAILRTPNKY